VVRLLMPLLKKKKKTEFVSYLIISRYAACCDLTLYCTLLEEMVLFRTRNGSIPHFIYGTPKIVLYRTIFFFLVKGYFDQVWNLRVLYRTQRNPFFKSV